MRNERNMSRIYTTLLKILKLEDNESGEWKRGNQLEGYGIFDWG